MKNKIPAILGITELIVALGALPAGWLLMTHPDGSGMHMSVDLLQGSPFPDYLIPGVFLFTVNGLFQLAASVLGFLRHRWAGYAGLALGIVLVSWICIQVTIIGLTSLLQPMFFIVGVLEIILASLIMKSKVDKPFHKDHS